MRQLPRFLTNARLIAASKPYPLAHFSSLKNPTVDALVGLAVQGHNIYFAKELEKFLDVDDKKFQAKSLFSILTKIWNSFEERNLLDSYEYTAEILNVIKNKNLFEEIIGFCKTDKTNRPLFFQMIDYKLSGYDFTLILRTPLKRLVMQEYDGKTAFDYALDLDNPEAALAYSYKLVNYVDDLEVVLRCKEVTKNKLEELASFNLEREVLMDVGGHSYSQEGIPIDLQIELSRRNMPLDKILSRLEKTLKIKDRFGKAPAVFFPYYDSEWSKKPIRAMRNFGMEIVDLYDNEVPFTHFLSPEDIEKLDKIILEKVRDSNGVVIVGNTANIDSALYKDDAKIPDFFDANNRRNFVELLTIKHALRLNKPIWGICGGMQLVAIATMNGKLIDVKDQYLKNNHLDKIRVAKDSFLKAKSLYHSDGDDAESDIMESYSAHYQAVEEAYLTKDARIVAYSENGDFKVVKAIEGEKIFLTQMHLENMLQTRSARNAVGNFAAACVADLERESERAYTPPSTTKIAMAEKVSKMIDCKFPYSSSL